MTFRRQSDRVNFKKLNAGGFLLVDKPIFFQSICDNCKPTQESKPLSQPQRQLQKHPNAGRRAGAQEESAL
jgi:hypothetical protein